MVLDEDLLAKAKGAGERLATAEREAQMAKADYHHAVRRLHLAGAPLREVADALGVSHQRVQQIVQAAGGTWWSRVWRSRRVGPDMLCSFCGLPPGAVAKLIAGPEVYICDFCVDLAEQVLRAGKPRETERARMAPVARRTRCSFCGKKPSRELKVVGGRDARACAECLQLCRRILDDRGQSTERPNPRS